MDVQLKVVHPLLEKTQKRTLAIALIATMPGCRRRERDRDFELKTPRPAEIFESHLKL
ncbi:MAG: hypothetical protein ACREQ2_11515 [Candidatus Binatia bacterium]